MHLRYLVLPILLACLCHTAANAQPRSHTPTLSTPRRILDVPGGTIRLTRDPRSGDLLYLVADGSLYRFSTSAPATTLYKTDSAAHHGVGAATGMAFGPDGTLYLVGNEAGEATTRGIIMRGRRVTTGDGFEWSVLARTEFYPRSNTNYDHTFNGVVVSPDGAWVFAASGSRTDHGELQTNNGLYPGLREVPLTSAIFRLPSNGENLELKNDEQYLKENGYLFVDGTRNTFDMAFNSEGELFGTENSGDRDDMEELNLLRAGSHYGFPWRMGTNNTPQQYPGYNPATDTLVNKESYGYLGGFYYNDPTYPSPPGGVTFTDPIINLGPAAHTYRDSASGAIIQLQPGQSLGTFTPHRSPLGIVFDTASTLVWEHKGSAFITSWTDGRAGGSNLLIPFNDEGQDVLEIRLMKKGDGRYELAAFSIASGFNQPIDMEIAGDRLYLLEYGTSPGIWEMQTLVPPASVEAGDENTVLLSAVTPNPVTTHATVTLHPRISGAVRAVLSDMLGRTVAVLHEGTAAAGDEIAISINADALPAGTYLLHARDAKAGTVRRVTILH